MNPLLGYSAIKLAELIRTGEVSSRQVVQTHIDKIRRVNPVLNAVVKDRYEEALAEADAADALLRQRPSQELPPLLGVPCTIKECFALSGMPNTSGLVSRKGLIAKQDATAVARLRSAGAIPLGVTNVSELCMWIESNNRVYGRTNNPYDPRRMVGGSSGGEGAIVGAGAVPFGLGSDIGGSIRMPAFFNGVFGHKPTGGLVPGSGQHPLPAGDALRYVTTGPLCRRAEDLMPLLRILAGPDGLDTGCREIALMDPISCDLRGLTVLMVPDNGLQSVHPELRAAQQRAAAALADAGARVIEQRLPLLRHSIEIWSAMLHSSEGPTFRSLLWPEGRPRFPLISWALRRSEHTLPALVLALLEQLPELTPKRTQRALEMGEALKRELTERLGARTVLLFPPHPRPAPRHYEPLRWPFAWVYTGIFNMMEVPVTQVPMGLSSKGLPLGVQVVGPVGADHLTIAVAMHLERAFGGWVPPPIG